MALPVMVPGWAGKPAVLVTANVWAKLAPQLFVAVTVMFPPVLPAVALMLLVVEVPVQPVGSVQV